MDVMFIFANYLSHPVFLGGCFRLHVVMIPSYKTPVEVLRMALHARDPKPGNFGTPFLPKIEDMATGKPTKKNDLESSRSLEPSRYEISWRL